MTETAEAAREADRAALRPLAAAAERLEIAAAASGSLIDALLAHDTPDRATTAALDRTLIRTERAFLDPEGIPNRPWYRHVIYAPKATYAPEVLPGVTEALDAADRDRTRLDAEVARLVAALNRAAAILSPPR